MLNVVVGTCNSDVGAGRPDDISQHDERCGAAFTLTPPAAACIAVIIGQSGGHCIGAADFAETGAQKASEAEGASSATSIKPAATSLYPTRIVTLIHPFLNLKL